MERLARIVEEDAPDFIGPYCRAASGGWALLCAAIAAAIAAEALRGDAEAWRFAAGPGAVGVLAAALLVEFLFRKLHFRHYGSGPVDRALSALFPAERTERGRRSQAHLRARAAWRDAPRPE